MTLLARARDARRPHLQLLTYPVVDPALGTQSHRDFGPDTFLTKDRMAWYWAQCAGGPKPGGELWAPLTADAAGLPEAYIITAEYDVLRDEGEAYGAHLRAAGIAAAVERYPGMIHGFLALVPDHEASKGVLSRSAAALREAFEAR